VLHPHQSDGLINAIMGADVDLSTFGLADGKAAVAAIIDAVPTVERLSRGRSLAAE
jgi:type IV secretion system protein VirD4